MARPSQEPNPHPASVSEYVAAEVRRRRLAKGLTGDACAERAGVPIPTWYHFESGKITLDRLPAIAAALGCSIRSLLPTAWPPE